MNRFKIIGKTVTTVALIVVAVAAWGLSRKISRDFTNNEIIPLLFDRNRALSGDIREKIAKKIDEVAAKLPIVINDRLDITRIRYDGNAIITTYLLKFEIIDSNREVFLNKIENDVRGKACLPNKGDDLKMRFRRVYEYYSTYNSGLSYIGSITIDPCENQ